MHNILEKLDASTETRNLAGSLILFADKHTGVDWSEEGAIDMVRSIFRGSGVGKIGIDETLVLINKDAMSNLSQVRP